MKALALGSATARELLGRPFTQVVLAATGLLLFLSSMIPSFTLEPEGDLKFMTDVGMAAVGMGLILIGLWPAATFLVDETAERTLLTLLSKPLSRRDYLVGRYLGVLGALAASALLLGVLFLGSVWLTEGGALTSRLDRFFEEAGMDEHHHGGEEGAPANTPAPPVRWRLAGTVLLGLGQAAVLSAVGLAFSTRLPVLPNLAATAGLFLAGHLRAPGILRLIVPDFACFEMSDAVARGALIPWPYVAGCLGYAALYVAGTLLVATLLFERRELT